MKPEDLSLLQALNLLATCGVLGYLIKTESRLSKLEAFVRVLLKQWNLIGDDDIQV